MSGKFRSAVQVKTEEIKYAPVAEQADAPDLGSVTTVEFSPAAVGQVKNRQKIE